MTSLILMVRAYAHVSSDMKLVDTSGLSAQPCRWEEAWVSRIYDHPVLGLCYIGSFVFGVGAVDCHFPFNHVRVCTREEYEKVLKSRYSYNWLKHVTKIADTIELSLLPIIKEL